jgi:hypothetical protein
VALVEFAFIVMLLFMLFLGITEFGVMMFRQLTLTQVAREGSRHASLGRPVEDVQERITNTAGALDASAIATELKYSTDNGLTYPYVLQDDSGGHNDAPPGSLIKVHLAYPNRLLFGSFFGFLSNVQNNTITLNTDVIMRRE